MNKILFFNSASVMNRMISLAKANGDTQSARNLYGLKCVGSLIRTVDGAINRLGGNYFFNFGYSELPTVTETSKNFSEVAISAAENLWSKNKHVCLFWSGGIDSTTALVALMMTNEHWKDALTIYSSQYAIDTEYPLFYDRYLKDADIRLLNGLEFYDISLYENDHIFVDGFCGGQIWPRVLPPNYGSENELEKYLKFCNEPYSAYYSTFNFTRNDLVIDYIEAQIEKFPMKIETVPELVWMLGFTHRWDPVRRRHMSCIPDQRHIHRMNCFFDTVEFQQWAMSNLKYNSMGSSWSANRCKLPAKDFIYSFTNDQDYRDNKTWVGSMSKTMSLQDLINRFHYTLVTEQIAVSKNESFEEVLMTTVST
jgi:hypothetical protein